MAGIADTNTIDLVAQDTDGTFLLIMVEDRRWGASDDHEAQLREKINTYAGYVLHGTLAQQYPETAAGSVSIRLDCLESPSGHFAHIVSHAATQLAAHGIGFQVNPRN